MRVSGINSVNSVIKKGSQYKNSANSSNISFEGKYDKAILKGALIGGLVAAPAGAIVLPIGMVVGATIKYINEVTKENKNNGNGNGNGNGK